jgi:hypothetical protein
MHESIPRVGATGPGKVLTRNERRLTVRATIKVAEDDSPECHAKFSIFTRVQKTRVALTEGRRDRR